MDKNKKKVKEEEFVIHSDEDDKHIFKLFRLITGYAEENNISLSLLFGYLDIVVFRMNTGFVESCESWRYVWNEYPSKRLSPSED